MTEEKNRAEEHEERERHEETASVRVNWSGFGGAVCSWVSSLRQSSMLTDVTVVAEGRSLRAHRLVLAASSALFRAIFEDNPAERPIVVLQDIGYAQLNRIVSYLYDGEVSVLERELPDFVAAAERLGVVGLTFPVKREPDDECRPADLLQLETLIKEEAESDNCDGRDDDADRNKKVTKLKSKRSIRKRKRSKRRVNKENVMHEIEEPAASATDGYCTDIDMDQEETCLNAVDAINAINATDLNDTQEEEDARQTFPCPFCGRIYYSWGYRRRHVKTHHESTSLTCKICHLSCSSEVMWYEHQVKAHEVPPSQARDSLVIMVEAHSVLAFSSPPSAVSMLHHLKLNGELV